MRLRVIWTIWLVFGTVSHGSDVPLTSFDELVAILNPELQVSDDLMISDSNSVSDVNSLETNSEAKTVSLSDNKETTNVVEVFEDVRERLLLEQMKTINVSARDGKNNELDSLIQQINSLQIPQKNISESTSRTKATSDVMKVESSALPIESTASQTQRNPNRFDNSIIPMLTKNVQSALHPTRLADVLYRRGNYQVAFQYYQYVHDQFENDDVVDYQWTLFQMANCCRQSDPQKAAQLYLELVESYPNSKWSAIALSRKQTIEWNQTNRIEEDYFVAEVHRDGAE